MSQMSTVRARAKRTLPSLPAKGSRNNRVFASPSSSPLSSRKKLTANTPSPSGVEKHWKSKLPIRKTQSLSEVQQKAGGSSTSNENLRKRAAHNASSEVVSRGVTNKKCSANGAQDLSKNTAGKEAEVVPPSGMENGLEKEDSFDEIKGGLTDSKLRTLTKSESVNSLDSLSFGSVNVEEERSCVTVAVRVRPFNQREFKNNHAHLCLGIEGNTILTSGPGLKHNFSYDQCFWSFDQNCETFATQEHVYKKIGQPLVENAFDGYNTCLFAYGQTGSGKSYSMMGLNQKEQTGIIPRFCEDLFKRIDHSPKFAFSVEISYFEIYNEKIHDLLDYQKGKERKKAHLRVREHPELGPYVEDLSTYIVSSYADIKSWLAVGNKCRATAATGMNEKSSRSHSVFTIVLTQTQTEVLEGAETQMSKMSKINLIDLAGSERASSALNNEVIDSKETYDLRLKEGGSINKSLHTLGKVISVLSSQEKTGKKKKVHIPYRDSVLTWLLKDSLGGNSKTAMIATVSPSSAHYEETMSTLRYASQARCIVNKARVNEDPNAKLIRELLAEIERLKESSISSEPEVNCSLNDEITMLREKLKETSALLAESTRNWQEKLEVSEKRKLEEADKLKKAGISFKVDNKLPNLVNLNEDPQLSEMLLYILKEGATTVGRRQSGTYSDHDIQLNGVLVAENHCLIRNEGENVSIVPIDDAPTYVNGQQLSEETVLHHGDRLVIGGDHYFRFNHPIEVEKRRQETTAKEPGDGSGAGDTVIPKDFEFARNELAQVQNARLQAELEEARIQAQEEIMAEIQVAKEAAQHELNEQKQCYEKRLTKLQSSLNEVGAEKTEIEKSHQSAEDKISQLQAHKMLLEQEILNNRKRLQMEALAAKQALEETKVNQVRIISELEKEKKKIRDDVEKLKNAKKLREQRKMCNANSKDDKGNGELLRLSVMLREANKISESLAKHLTFSRDDILLNDKMEVKIRLNNTKLGITTVWSLEKFESKLMHMRETYQQNESDSISGDEDPFNDPEDQWEKDFRLDSPSEATRMSRRETLDLVSNLKNSLASLSSKGSPSVLYGVSPRARVLVNNSVNRQQEKAENIFAKYKTPESTSSNEPTKTSSSQSPSSSPPPPDLYNLGPALRGTCSVPAICREMVSGIISKMEGLSVTREEPLHERIIKGVNQICISVSALRKAYKNDNEEDKGVPLRETEPVRRHTIQVMTSLEQLLEQTRSWRMVLDACGSEKIREMTIKLLDSVRRVAAHLAKLLMGCDGDMVSLIEETEDKVELSLSILVKQVAKLTVASTVDLTEEVLADELEIRDTCAAAFIEGQNLVLRDTIQECNKAMKESLSNFQKFDDNATTSEVEKETRDDAIRLLKSVMNFIRNEDDIQKSLAALQEVMSHSISGKRVFHCHQVVGSTRAIIDASNRLTAAIVKTKMSSPKLLTAMIELANELKTSVTQVVENTQYILELDTNGTTKSEKPSATISSLFASKDKLKIQAKNVRLTSRELTKTLRKYSFLCEKRASDRELVTSVYGTPVSRTACGLRDRTNAQGCLQKKHGNEYGQSSPSNGVVILRCKESPI